MSKTPKPENSSKKTQDIIEVLLWVMVSSLFFVLALASVYLAVSK